MEYRFPAGVIIDLPEGFDLVETTVMIDPLPRMLVTISANSPAAARSLESIQPKEAD